jgi:MinD-like ATPase involved in chromosome partitioning or flagellar assembly
VTLIAVVGDCTTTTCVALAAGWPLDDDVVVLEVDPSGGSLAAWLDLAPSPSLATIVASGPDAAVGAVTTMAQHSRSGLRVVPAPIRSRPARRAVEEAAGTVVPGLVATPDVLVLADAGRAAVADLRVQAAAPCVVVVHRQEMASAAAEAARLERLVEHVEMVTAAATSAVLAVVGTDPFDPDEIAHYVDGAVPGGLATAVRLPVDPLAAAVLAGRSGVSATRLRRLPLMRAAVTAATRIRGAAVDTAAGRRTVGTGLLPEDGP